MYHTGPGSKGVGTERGCWERARSVGPATAGYVQGPVNALNLDFLKSLVPHVWLPGCPPALQGLSKMELGLHSAHVDRKVC